MFRSLRWPLLAVTLVTGLAIGRWTDLSPVQGQPVAPVVIPAEIDLLSRRCSPGVASGCQHRGEGEATAG